MTEETSQSSIAERDEADLMSTLTRIAVNRVKGFNYVVGATAAVSMAMAVIGVGPSARAAILVTIALLLIAVILFILRFASKDALAQPKVSARVGVIVTFVLGSVAVAFAALLLMLLIWLWQFVSPDAKGAHNTEDRRTAGELRVDALGEEVYALRGVWESALAGNQEPSLPAVASKSSELAQRLSDIPAEQLSVQYSIWRARWVAYAHMLSCSSASLIPHDSATERCKAGLLASEEAVQLVTEARTSRNASDSAAENWDWVVKYNIEGKILRDYATLSVLTFELTGDAQHRQNACNALERIDVGYSMGQEDPVQSSPILRRVLQTNSPHC